MSPTSEASGWSDLDHRSEHTTIPTQRRTPTGPESPVTSAAPQSGLPPVMPTSVSALCGPQVVAAFGEISFDPAAHYFAPELSSLAGTELWESLDDERRCAVLRHEAALVASNTIHGESQVLGGLAPRQDEGPDYLQVFSAEEVNHQQMFRAYLDHLQIEVLPTRAIGWTERELSDPEFYACTYVFEDIVGRINRRLARHPGVHPMTRAVNHAHAVEEAQHLRFGRGQLAQVLPTLSETERSDLAELVTAYLRAVWRERYRSDVYELAGLQRPWQVAREAFESMAQRRLRLQFTSYALAPLAALPLDAKAIAA